MWLKGQAQVSAQPGVDDLSLFIQGRVRALPFILLLASSSFHLSLNWPLEFRGTQLNRQPSSSFLSQFAAGCICKCRLCASHYMILSYWSSYLCAIKLNEDTRPLSYFNPLVYHPIGLHWLQWCIGQPGPLVEACLLLVGGSYSYRRTASITNHID